MDEIQAAILLARLPRLDETNNRRREIALRYNEVFRTLRGLVCPIESQDCYHVYHLYVLQVSERNNFQAFLRQKGVATLIHYPVPIHRQEAYAECREQQKFLEHTDRQVVRIVSLPVYPEMTDEQVEYVINSVREWGKKNT